MQARQEKDGKHSVGIGGPKRTARWIDFTQAKARQVTTILT